MVERSKKRVTRNSITSIFARVINDFNFHLDAVTIFTWGHDDSLQEIILQNENFQWSDLFSGALELCCV